MACVPLLPSLNAFCPECTLRRYNLETMPVDKCMCCMRCTLVCSVPELSLHVPPRSPCCRLVGTRNPESLPISCVFHTSAHFSFASVSQSSYRNRYVAVASFSDSLPWHPFCSAMVTKCFITCSCQHFHKNCIKLAYVTRIMITTFKMFKIVVCIKLLNDIWGFSGMVVCCSGLI